MQVTANGTNVASTTGQSKQTEQMGQTSAKKFLEFMEKTPEEMLFDSFLKKNNLTQEQFDRLSLEDREELLKQFKEEIMNKKA